MYCPQCGVEYRDRFTECSDCHVALVFAAERKRLDSQPELAVVFESTDRLAIGLAKGLLEHAGIPFWMEDNEIAARLVLGPVMFPLCRFVVPKYDEAKARELLESLQSPEEK